MSDDPHEEGPVCDFCEIPVDPDETLEPIYVGEQPQPNPHYLSEVAQRGTASNRGRYEEMHLLGKPLGIYQAMYMALEDCSDVELSESMRVEIPNEQAVSVDGNASIVTGNYSPSYETRDDMVGIEMKIHPKNVTYEPDAEVCDTCAEMFKEMKD